MSVVAAELRETGDALLYGVRSAVECETAGLKAEQPGAERPTDLLGGRTWDSEELRDETRVSSPKCAAILTAHSSSMRTDL